MVSSLFNNSTAAFAHGLRDAAHSVLHWTGSAGRSSVKVSAVVSIPFAMHGMLHAKGPESVGYLAWLLDSAASVAAGLAMTESLSRETRELAARMVLPLGASAMVGGLVVAYGYYQLSATQKGGEAVSSQMKSLATVASCIGATLMVTTSAVAFPLGLLAAGSVIDLSSRTYDYMTQEQNQSAGSFVVGTVALVALPIFFIHSLIEGR